MTAYLDHAATTPMRAAAREAYLAALETLGNPSSVHTHGQAARRALEDARDEVAAALGADPIEVVFTSGGTEASNLALKGTYWARGAERPRPRILLSRAEHHATLDAVDWLERRAGATARWLEVDAQGVLRPDELDAALGDSANPGDDIALITTLLVNNEVGAVQPVRGLARLAREAGIPFHVDAVAALGHTPVSLRELGVDTIAVSAHKIGGPVGIGALAVSRTASLEALHHGGGQQRGLRSGTQDVAGAAAFAAALREMLAEADTERQRVRALRDRLLEGVLRLVLGAELRGPEPGAALDDDGVIVPARSEANAHVTIAGVAGESLMFLLDAAGVAASSGSACQAGVTEVSHVLRAMGVSPDVAGGAVRLSLGATSTDADVDAVLAVLPGAVARASGRRHS